VSIRVRSSGLNRFADRQCLFGPVHQTSKLWGELAMMCAQTELCTRCRKPVSGAIQRKWKLNCASSVDNFNHLTRT
jgi:hypothetical protein